MVDKGGGGSPAHTPISDPEGVECNVSHQLDIHRKENSDIKLLC